MAAIADTIGSFDCSDFLQKIQRALPPYARPVFLRISPHVDTTGKLSQYPSWVQKNVYHYWWSINSNLFYVSPHFCIGTFKIQKTRLQREGYDPRLTTDQIYFLNTRAARYEAVDEELYNAIAEGRMSLWHGGYSKAVMVPQWNRCYKERE